jgi:predicted Zn-dependent peptidase
MIATSLAVLLSAALAAPATAPAATSTSAADPVTFGKTSGIDLLVKRRPGADFFTAQLYVLGGSRNWGAADAGVETLAFRVATSGGAGGLDKEEFGRELARLGATIHASTTRDWSVITAKGPTRNFSAIFRLLTDSFTSPALTAAEVELQRGQLVVQLQQRGEDPDGRLGELVNQALFTGHPYANPPAGTLQSMPKLDLAAVSSHLKKVRERSRLLLVVVGDVEATRVQAKVTALLSGLPQGSYRATPLPRPTFKAARLVTEKRAIPTNYIEAMAPAPGPGQSGYVATRIGLAALQQRLFVEVRTKRNLSYAPAAAYDVNGAGGWAGIYVTAVDPNTTLPIMLGELKKLAAEPLGAEELAGTRSLFRTRQLMGLETTDDEATGLAVGQLYAGDWRYRSKVLAESATVTAAQVQAAAKGAYQNLQFVLLGDPGKLDPKLIGLK